MSGRYGVEDTLAPARGKRAASGRPATTSYTYLARSLLAEKLELVNERDGDAATV